MVGTTGSFAAEILAQEPGVPADCRAEGVSPPLSSDVIDLLEWVRDAVEYEGQPARALRCLDAMPAPLLDPFDRGLADLYRGVAHKYLARPDSAEFYLVRGRDELAETAAGDPSTDEAVLAREISFNLGTVYDDQGILDRAVAAYEVALSDLDPPEEVAYVRNALGVVQRRRGFPDSAVVIFDRALVEADPWLRPVLLLNRGLARGDLGDPGGLEDLGAARSEALQNDDPLVAAGAQRFVANVRDWMEVGPPETSLATYREAAEEFDAVLSSNAASDFDLVSYQEASDLLTLHRDWAAATLRAESPAAVEEALRTADRGRGRALQLLLEDGPGEAGSTDELPPTFLYYQFSSRPRAYGEREGGGLDLITTWWRVREGPIRARTCEADPDEVSDLVGQALFDAGVSEADALASVTREIVIVESTGESGSQDNRIRLAPPPGPGRCWPEPEEGTVAADLLADGLLPAEFLTALPADEPVLLVPDGPLWALPFVLLPVDGSPLGLRNPLRYAHSLDTDAHLTARRPRAWDPAGGLIVANPTMPTWEGQAIQPLPFAEDEGYAVRGLTGAAILVGDEASEARFRREAGSASFLHLATHGLAFRSSGRARDSFLALAPEGGDGLLTVAEVMDHERFPNLSAELVVLSACQTGVGAIRGAEGTVGLARAFIARGARGVVVTLWSVPDRDTAQLMDRFYEALLAGASPAEALRTAQTALSDREPWRWAAFQLVGGG
jgi:tetratricopeptide (TPR) repeat protein